MVIYEFTTWSFSKKFNGFFSVSEIEVEEKPKSYIGKNCRINKSEIGILKSSFGNTMYLLENKPEIYINAMIEHYKKNVNRAETNLIEAQKKLTKWSDLAKMKGGAE